MAEWRERARCKGSADESFFNPEHYLKAKAICSPCPVKAECLAEAMKNEERYGVWGGRSPSARGARKNKNPNRLSRKDEYAKLRDAAMTVMEIALRHGVTERTVQRALEGPITQ